MNATPRETPVDQTLKTLACIRSKGVRVWAVGGELHYKAPKGALSGADIAALCRSRESIVALVERFGKASPAPPSEQPAGRVPLTYSQLVRWDSGHLAQRPALRQLASATRLRGELDTEILRDSLQALVCRHDALRTQIIVTGGRPEQELAEARHCPLQIVDLTSLSREAKEAELQRLIEQLIAQQIRVDVDPLFAFMLTKLGKLEHVLILVMDQIISDAYSMNIMLRDLLALYAGSLQSRPAQLPSVDIQFSEYAIRQNRARKHWLEDHGAYWEELSQCPALRFPEPRHVPQQHRRGWGTIALRIEQDLKSALGEWSRLHHTTLVMSVLMAYIGTVLRWCEARDGIFRFETDGRADTTLENTIGFFAVPIYLHAAMGDGDDLLDLLTHVVDAYCRAHEHADFLYMEVHAPSSAPVKATYFNWIPQEPRSDLACLRDSTHSLLASPVRFAHPMFKDLEMECEPSIFFYEGDNEITADLIYPLSRFCRDTMQEFADNLLAFMRTLARHRAIK